MGSGNMSMPSMGSGGSMPSFDMSSMNMGGSMQMQMGQQFMMIKPIICSQSGMLSTLMESDTSSAEFAKFIDTSAIEQCICSDTFDMNTLTSLTMGGGVNGSGMASAMTAFCSNDCKSMLDMGLSMAKGMGVVPAEMSDLSATTVSDCMCSMPDTMSFFASGAKPDTKMIMGLMGSTACTGLMKAGLSIQMSQAGVTPASDCTTTTATECVRKCTPCIAAVGASMAGATDDMAVDADGNMCDTCQPCLPYTICALGGDSAASASPASVAVTLTVAGTVSEYEEESTKTTLRQNMADKVGVELADVTLTIKSGSVILEFDIKTSTPAQASMVSAVVNSDMSSEASAAAVLDPQGTLGVVVEAVPVTITVTEDSSSNTTTIAIAAAAGAAGAVLLVAALFFMMKGKGGSPSSPKVKADASISSSGASSLS